MSYTKYIENYMIKFKDEISYLNCRKEYLELEINKDVSFLIFIQSGLSHKYEWHVEKISKIMTDNNIFSPIYATTTDATATNYNYFVVSQPNTSTLAANIYGGSIYTNSGVLDDLQLYSSLDYKFPMDVNKINKIKKKKEELPPDDPIEDRFSILDL
jgi:hypothetical protein